MPEAAPAIDRNSLARAFAELGLGEPVDLTLLEGGSATSYRVSRRNADEIVLKIYSDRRGDSSGKEAFAASLLAKLGVPITRVMARDESLSRLPFRYAVSNYLPGVRVAVFRDAPDAADLYRDMGGLLRRLHGVSLPAFGAFNADGIVDPMAVHSAYIVRLWTTVLERFRHFGAAPDLADRLDQIVTQNLGLVVHTSGPVFAHDDFQPNNLLAERSADGRLRLTGLIDFGNARAADATFDLAKALFCCEHEAPGSTRAILEGYGPIDHPDPQRALWLYTLIHRVVMWYWLRHVGVIADGEPHPLIADLHAMAEEKTV
ncbi:aminoglycoside phosphotransferase family protein [Devosia sp. FKR38]|uniref:phosphotransferase family protein n=1 Tax=Devosia sp. FKR38 TaxID=2562312 RepID=UPI0010C14935|nr:aminoglycoside phosphotransferase family protein [Devosia sp. FKR38]